MSLYDKMLIQTIGVGAQSTLGGHNILPEEYVWKIYKMSEFYMILAWKINKIPEFYMIFARKMPEFYIIIARKIFSPDFFLGGRARASLSPPAPPLPSPMPMIQTTWHYCIIKPGYSSSTDKWCFCPGVAQFPSFRHRECARNHRRSVEAWLCGRRGR